MITAALLAQLVVGGQVVPVFTHADPAAGGPKHSEIRFVAPLVFSTLDLLGTRVRLHAMLNFEGWTMPGGQLGLGTWGEGYVDRRHPHTVAHELMLTYQDVVRAPAGVRWSITGGKGFAPFGTEDPMTRPALAYPVNHHWSQVLERIVVIGALRKGPVTIEAGLFNGDEPEHYTQWPLADRFGDSWSARLTVRPLRGLALSASRARITSPEHRNAAGLDHDLWNVSAEVRRLSRFGMVTALAEWSEADEEGAFQFTSLLGEAQVESSRSRGYVRVERTDRPEERQGDLYRSPRPHSENSNFGTTRWFILTAGFGQQLLEWKDRVRLEGIVEAQRLRVTSVTGGIFDPALFYGGNDLWQFSVGVRIAAGERVHRMGRYGVAVDQPSNEHRHQP